MRHQALHPATNADPPNQDTVTYAGPLSVYMCSPALLTVLPRAGTYRVRERLEVNNICELPHENAMARTKHVSIAGVVRGICERCHASP